MSPFRTNENIAASHDGLGLTAADQAALKPLDSLPPEACPPELAARTIRCLCALARAAHASAPAPTPRPYPHDQEDL